MIQEYTARARKSIGHHRAPLTGAMRPLQEQQKSRRERGLRLL